MRFKVGQKVRVVKPYSYSDFHDGEIVEVVGIVPLAYYGRDCYKAVSCENKDKDWWCLCEDEVEPIESEDKAVPLTNGDKIRAMNNEQLADLILFYADIGRGPCDNCKHKYTVFCDKPNNCKAGMLAWLNSEVEDN